VTDELRTRLAKTLFWCAGYLSRIKTPQRVYELASRDPLDFRPAGWEWMSCETSMRLLKASTQIDPAHWDHWALGHNECGSHRCPQCGGCVCEDEATP